MSADSEKPGGVGHIDRRLLGGPIARQGLHQRPCRIGECLLALDDVVDARDRDEVELDSSTGEWKDAENWGGGVGGGDGEGNGRGRDGFSVGGHVDRIGARMKGLYGIEPQLRGGLPGDDNAGFLPLIGNR